MTSITIGMKNVATSLKNQLENQIMETVLGVTDVNSPSDDAAAAEEGGTVVNEVMFLNFFCYQKSLISILARYLLLFLFKKLVMLFPQVLMKLLL